MLLRHPVSVRLRRRLGQMAVLVLSLGLTACGCGNSGGADTAPFALRIQSPTVSTRAVCRGGVVTISWIDAGLSGRSETDVYADRDGDPSTTHDRHMIAAGVMSHGAGQAEVRWDTSGLGLGTWRIFADTREGSLDQHMVLGDVEIRDGAVAAWQDGGAGFDLVNTISVRNDCGVYACGSFDPPSATFDAGNPLETTFTGSRIGAWLARYDRQGTLLWINDGQLPAGSTSGGIRGGACATDAQGGVVFTAMYAGAPELRDTTGGTTTLAPTNPARQSLLLARYDETGRLLWTSGLDALDGNAWSIGVDVAPDGSIAFVGAFAHRATIGSVGDPNRTEITTSGIGAFVSRWNADGSLRWVRVIDTPASASAFNFARRVVHSPSGELLVVGRTDSADLHFQTSGQVLSAPLGGRQSFVARYAPDGVLRWADTVASIPGGWCEAVTLAPLEDGGLALSGQVKDGATLAAGRPSQVDLTTPGTVDGFVARYSAAGEPLWSRTIGGDTSAGGETDASGIAVAHDGAVILVGKFFGTAAFGPGPDGQPLTATSQDDADAFRLRLEVDDGRMTWFHTDGGPLYDHACDVKVCPDGCMAIAGWFHGLFTVNEGGPKERALLTGGDGDAFVYVVNPDGDF